jgi:hypothetical protein
MSHGDAGERDDTGRICVAARRLERFNACVPKQKNTRTLQDLLDQMTEAAEDCERISVEDILHAVGRRSFGPMLMVPGLIALSPLSGIPGAPTITGSMVLLVAGQLLIGRDEFWLPKFILRRSVSQEKFRKAVKYTRPVARFVDRLVNPRLTMLTNGAAMYIVAAVCVMLAVIAPLLELLPFAITVVGGAISAFGLAITAEDGVLAIIAFIFCIGAAVLIVVGLM